MRVRACCLLLGTLALNVLAGPFPADNVAHAAPSPPHVILIMADDVGYECFGCYGSKQYQTPHLDRLAAKGLRFTHCYSQPLCTPSRVKIMTGISNVRNYSAFSVLNSDQKTIGQYFQAAGYKTMIAGKWQLLGAEHYSERFRKQGSWPQQSGFDKACLWQVDRLGSRFWEPLLHVDGENRQFGKDEYGPEICTRQINAFLKENHESPCFVYYPMILVHSPFLPTPHSASRTSKDKQKNFEDMVAYMDTLVGRIVKQTEELGIAKDTLILFTGDNGTHKTIRSQLDGVTIPGGKGKTTDAGTREPLVAYRPGFVPAGKVCEDLVDFSDFLPTLLEAAGAPPPKGLDGQSFLPQLRGEPGKPREWMHCFYCPRPERTKPVRFVRDRRFKLYGDGRFFDVKNDPLEKQPLDDLPSGSPAAIAQGKLTRALASMPAEGQSLLKFAPADK
ncbi:MAG: arylsulfatase A [Planctomycetaceae bacterium]|nr:arylsulfatase A [Planctomycetaceae bacterium]